MGESQVCLNFADCQHYGRRSVPINYNKLQDFVGVDSRSLARRTSESTCCFSTLARKWRERAMNKRRNIYNDKNSRKELSMHISTTKIEIRLAPNCLQFVFSATLIVAVNSCWNWYFTMHANQSWERSTRCPWKAARLLRSEECDHRREHIVNKHRKAIIYLDRCVFLFRDVGVQLIRLLLKRIFYLNDYLLRLDIHFPGWTWVRPFSSAKNIYIAIFFNFSTCLLHFLSVSWNLMMN